LKGTAATIGAGEISATAAKIESAIRDGSGLGSLSYLLDGLEPLLGDLTSALESQMALEAPADSGDPPDANRLSEVYHRLARLLADDDAEAEEVLVLNAELLCQAFPAEYGFIAAQVRNFEFEQALQTLEEAVSRKGDR
jgi:two-component system sensor histidine kinase/response regulator